MKKMLSCFIILGSSIGKDDSLSSCKDGFDSRTEYQFNVTVTQLDRVLGYELRSREFESLRSHQYRSFSIKALQYIGNV